MNGRDLHDLSDGRLCCDEGEQSGAAILPLDRGLGLKKKDFGASTRGVEDAKLQTSAGSRCVGGPESTVGHDVGSGWERSIRQSDCSREDAKDNDDASRTNECSDETDPNDVVWCDDAPNAEGPVVRGHGRFLGGTRPKQEPTTKEKVRSKGRERHF